MKIDKICSIMALFIVLSAVNFFPLQHAVADDGDIAIKNAWIREAPPNSRIMAGYFDIINNSDNEYILLSAESEAFEYIEFHLSQIKDGVSTMRRQGKLVIPAGATFTLRPGEYHLMLVNNSVPVRAGKQISIQLIFANAKTYIFSAVVKRGMGLNTDE